MTMSAAFGAGDVVDVMARLWPGINKHGGVARVTLVTEDQDDCYYDVVYLVNGGKEFRVHEQFIRSVELNLGPRRSKGRCCWCNSFILDCKHDQTLSPDVSANDDPAGNNTTLCSDNVIELANTHHNEMNDTVRSMKIKKKNVGSLVEQTELLQLQTEDCDPSLTSTAMSSTYEIAKQLHRRIFECCLTESPTADDDLREYCEFESPPINHEYDELLLSIASMETDVTCELLRICLNFISNIAQLSLKHATQRESLQHRCTKDWNSSLPADEKSALARDILELEDKQEILFKRIERAGFEVFLKANRRLKFLLRDLNCPELKQRREFMVLKEQSISSNWGDSMRTSRRHLEVIFKLFEENFGESVEVTVFGARTPTSPSAVDHQSIANLESSKRRLREISEVVSEEEQTDDVSFRIRKNKNPKVRVNRKRSNVLVSDTRSLSSFSFPLNNQESLEAIVRKASSSRRPLRGEFVNVNDSQVSCSRNRRAQLSDFYVRQRLVKQRSRVTCDSSVPMTLLSQKSSDSAGRVSFGDPNLSSKISRAPMMYVTPSELLRNTHNLASRSCHLDSLSDLSAILFDYKAGFGVPLPPENEQLNNEQNSNSFLNLSEVVLRNLRLLSSRLSKLDLPTAVSSFLQQEKFLSQSNNSSAYTELNQILQKSWIDCVELNCRYDFCEIVCQCIFDRLQRLIILIESHEDSFIIMDSSPCLSIELWNQLELECGKFISLVNVLCCQRDSIFFEQFQMDRSIDASELDPAYFRLFNLLFGPEVSCTFKNRSFFLETLVNASDNPFHQLLQCVLGLTGLLLMIPMERIMKTPSAMRNESPLIAPIQDCAQSVTFCMRQEFQNLAVRAESSLCLLDGFLSISQRLSLGLFEAKNESLSCGEILALFSIQLLSIDNLCNKWRSQCFMFNGHSKQAKRGLLESFSIVLTTALLNDANESMSPVDERWGRFVSTTNVATISQITDVNSLWSVVLLGSIHSLIDQFRSSNPNTQSRMTAHWPLIRQMSNCLCDQMIGTTMDKGSTSEPGLILSAVHDHLHHITLMCLHWDSMNDAIDIFLSVVHAILLNCETCATLQLVRNTNDAAVNNNLIQEDSSDVEDECDQSLDKELDMSLLGLFLSISLARFSENCGNQDSFHNATREFQQHLCLICSMVLVSLRQPNVLRTNWKELFGDVHGSVGHVDMSAKVANWTTQVGKLQEHFRSLLKNCISETTDESTLASVSLKQYKRLKLIWHSKLTQERLYSIFTKSPTIRSGTCLSLFVKELQSIFSPTIVFDEWSMRESLVKLFVHAPLTAKTQMESGIDNQRSALMFLLTLYTCAPMTTQWTLADTQIDQQSRGIPGETHRSITNKIHSEFLEDEKRFITIKPTIELAQLVLNIHVVNQDQNREDSQCMVFGCVAAINAILGFELSTRLSIQQLLRADSATTCTELTFPFFDVSILEIQLSLVELLLREFESFLASGTLPRKQLLLRGVLLECIRTVFRVIERLMILTIDPLQSLLGLLKSNETVVDISIGDISHLERQALRSCLLTDIWPIWAKVESLLFSTVMGKILLFLKASFRYAIPRCKATHPNFSVDYNSRREKSAILEYLSWGQFSSAFHEDKENLQDRYATPQRLAANAIDSLATLHRLQMFQNRVSASNITQEKSTLFLQLISLDSILELMRSFEAKDHFFVLALQQILWIGYLEWWSIASISKKGSFAELLTKHILYYFEDIVHSEFCGRLLEDANIAPFRRSFSRLSQHRSNISLFCRSVSTSELESKILLKQLINGWFDMNSNALCQTSKRENCTTIAFLSSFCRSVLQELTTMCNLDSKKRLLSSYFDFIDKKCHLPTIWCSHFLSICAFHQSSKKVSANTQASIVAHGHLLRFQYLLFSSIGLDVASELDAIHHQRLIFSGASLPSCKLFFRESMSEIVLQCCESLSQRIRKVNVDECVHWEWFDDPSWNLYCSMGVRAWRTISWTAFSTAHTEWDVMLIPILYACLLRECVDEKPQTSTALSLFFEELCMQFLLSLQSSKINLDETLSNEGLLSFFRLNYYDWPFGDKKEATDCWSAARVEMWRRCCKRSQAKEETFVHIWNKIGESLSHQSIMASGTIADCRCEELYHYILRPQLGSHQLSAPILGAIRHINSDSLIPSSPSQQNTIQFCLQGIDEMRRLLAKGKTESEE